MLKKDETNRVIIREEEKNHYLPKKSQAWWKARQVQ